MSVETGWPLSHCPPSPQLLSAPSLSQVGHRRIHQSLRMMMSSSAALSKVGLTWSRVNDLNIQSDTM